MVSKHGDNQNWSRAWALRVVPIVLLWVVPLVLVSAVVFIPWVDGVARAEIEVQVRILDAGTGDPIPGAMVLSVPRARFFKDVRWWHQEVSEHMSLSLGTYAMSGAGSCLAFADEDGRCVGKFSFHTSESASLWRLLSGVRTPITHGRSMHGLVVSAHGYETCWVAADRMEWTPGKTVDGFESASVTFPDVRLAPKG